MKKLTTLLLPLLALTSVSCSSTWDVGPDPSGTKYRIAYKCENFVEDPIEIRYEFDYDLKDFGKDSTVFNKNIALLSFAKETMATDAANIHTFYTDLGFDSIYRSESYAQPDHKDTIQFAMAHRDMAEFHLVSVATNGLTYKKPWANNFVLGLEGDAEGFVIPALTIIDQIKSYVGHYTDKTVKLWISGYSRTAAVTDIVSYRLIDQGVFAEKDLFVYTFEAPQAVSSANTKQYNSIFNIMNQADLVTHVAPSAYGLKRVGRDIDLHNDQIDTWITQIDSRIQLAPFHPSKGIETEGQNVESILTALMDPSLNLSEDVGMDTREHYVKFHQNAISYALELFMGLKFSTVVALLEGINVNALASFMAEDGLYNYLKSVLDAQKETYDDQKLRDMSNSIAKMLTSMIGVLLTAASICGEGANLDNFIRSLEFHFPEVVLVSLYNYKA